MSEPPVITRVTGHLGHITLNRPAAINALTAEMVELITRTLAGWSVEDRVRAVAIDGAGERGLCAGGEIRAIHADAVSGGTASLGFWAEEYQLNATINEYPKPIIALMDGVVMGGGIGISGHASVRVVTERSRLAMPEVGIGFHPDVGGSWLLSHAPGEIGTHLALTGSAIGAGDGIAAGLADHFVPSARLPELLAALSESDPHSALLSTETGPPPADLDRTWIDECYAGDDVAVILDRLTNHAHPAAQAAAKEIATKSPTSLVLTLRSLRAAAGLPNLRAALDAELRLSAVMLRLPDLAEGIRAQIIDKDRRPRWQPASLKDVVPGPA